MSTTVSVHPYVNNHERNSLDERFAFIEGPLIQQLGKSPARTAERNFTRTIRVAGTALAFGEEALAQRALGVAADLGLALFIACGADGPVEFELEGRPVRGSGAVPNGAAWERRWVQSYALAALLERPEVMSRLRAYPVERFDLSPGEVDGFWRPYADAWRVLPEGDAEKAWERFDNLFQDDKIEVATAMDIARVRAIRALATTIGIGGQDGFDSALVTALETHRAYWADPERLMRLDGLFALEVCALVRWALDAGLALNVESMYLPAWLLHFRAAP